MFFYSPLQSIPHLQIAYMKRFFKFKRHASEQSLVLSAGSAREGICEGICSKILRVLEKKIMNTLYIETWI